MNMLFTLLKAGSELGSEVKVGMMKVEFHWGMRNRIKSFPTVYPRTTAGLPFNIFRSGIQKDMELKCILINKKLLYDWKVSCSLSTKSHNVMIQHVKRTLFSLWLINGLDCISVTTLWSFNTCCRLIYQPIFGIFSIKCQMLQEFYFDSAWRPAF